MKRLLILLGGTLAAMTLFGASPPSGSYSGTILDSIAVADTAVANVRTDYDTSDVVAVHDYEYIAFYGGAYGDSAFANDSCFAILQLSVYLGDDTYDWQTVDTVLKILPNDSTYAGVTHKLDTLGYVADYMRLVLARRHKFAATQPGLLANTYTFTVKVWTKLWD